MIILINNFSKLLNNDNYTISILKTIHIVIIIITFII
jgi:hypothetical protein